MGGPGSIWTLNLGVSFIYGGSWAHVDPKTRGSRVHPKTQGPPRSSLGALVPRVPQNSAVPLIYGAPEVFSAPEFGDTLSYVGCPVGIWGSPSFVGCLGTSSTPKLRVPRGPQNSGVPLFYGVPSVLSTLKPGGGGSCVPPNSGGAPFDSVSWSGVRPKTWGSHAHPEIRGPPPLWGARVPRVPQNSGVALISGVPSSHLYPKIRGSPPIWGALGPSVPQNWGGSRVHPKTQGPPHCPLGALGSCAP